MELRGVDASAVIVGLDFSTGSVKGLAFDLEGQNLAEVRLPTDLWTADGVSELSALQLEGQARAAIRGMATRLRTLGRLENWAAIGISATHHTAGRIDSDHNPIRRLICWNDQSLATYHKRGMQRLGGPDRAKDLTGGPWAIRYSLSHLVKDEEVLSADEWQRTVRILPHGALVAGYLTGRFDATSVSSAASTGIMDLRTNRWQPAMLDALAYPENRAHSLRCLPVIVDAAKPLGPLAENVALEAGIPLQRRPLVFPTSDDQQAGLIGGGAVAAGDVAIVLGNSAVVNSSAERLPHTSSLDAMRLNWGPYLWMRCYNNGAQFLDPILGANPDWAALERAARSVPPGCGGITVSPFLLPEPSRGVSSPRLDWTPAEPQEPGVRYRAALEALAYLIALGVREHESAGQPVRRIVISGGIAKSDLMGEILASVVDRPLERLASNEGPALGAAVTALWGLENTARTASNDHEPYEIAVAVKQLVRYRDPVRPVAGWKDVYDRALQAFSERL